MDKALKLYTYVDGINDIPFPSIKDQIEILRFTYDVKTMGGTPTISASIMYKDCLDNVWSGKQYAIYNGEKYYIKQTASSSYSNTDARYKHDLELVSDRFTLESTYFYDAVVENEDVDKYVSNSTKVSFFGDIKEFVHRLNKSMKRSGLLYSVVVDSDVTSEAFLVSFDNQYITNALQSIFDIYGLPYYYVGYVIHVGKDFKEIPYTFKYGADNSLLKIEKTNANYKVIRRCTATGSSDNIPYYYPNDTPKGNVSFSTRDTNVSLSKEDISIINGSKLISKLDVGDELMYHILRDVSFSYKYKTFYKVGSFITEYTSSSYEIGGTGGETHFNANFSTLHKFKVLKRGEFTLTFKRVVENSLAGYSERIPWNNKGKCFINTKNSNPKEIKYSIISSDVIELDLGFLKEGDYEIEMKEYLEGQVKFFKITPFLVVGSTQLMWRLLGTNDYYFLDECGLKISKDPHEYDVFSIVGYTKVPDSQNILPSKYRETKGAERFYNALNNTYINPDTGEYYQFENEYTSNNPSEYVLELDDIKPTIKGSTNKANQRIDMFSEFAYDTNDNDELTTDDKYVHPYFFGKLRKFDGDNSFNLFEHAIESGEMTISMTSGNCGACNFVIGVDKDSQKNLVQVDSNGQLMRDKDGDVRCGRKKSSIDSPMDSQNDTSENEVWIALRKDQSTFNVLMPNSLNNYKPTANSDTFVVLNISLPKSYIIAAEKKIEKELIKYMSQNNSEKFNFSIDLSRIFLAQNIGIYSQLNENRRLKVEYNSSIYSLYVSSYSYAVTETEVLPQIRVDLGETLTVNKGVIQNAVDGVKRDITNIIANINPLSEGNKYYLRKDIPNTAEKKITFKEGFDVGDYEKLISGASLFIDSDGKTNLDIDKLHVRLKAYFETLEIKRAVHTGGINISSAAALVCSKVVDREDVINPETGEIISTDIWGFYRCYFVNNKEGITIYNEFRDGDQAYSKETNIELGFTNRFYWRLVVGTGVDYIDLSKDDCISDSSIPQVGDDIIQYGNRYDTSRQNVIIQSTVSDDSPSLKFYQGINSYDLAGKEVMSFYYDRVTRKSQMKVYGDAFIGKADNSSYMKYTTENGLEIKGKLSVGTTMGDGSTLEDALEKYKNDAINASNKNLADYASQVTIDIDDLQNQIDGAVESYFKEYDPTLDNEPANGWQTDADKERHGNDTFTNSLSGKSWRWAKLSNKWQWVVITDTATEKALAAASKAQDTADGKRKVFVRQPLNTEDYAIGDLWVNATYGTTYLNDLLRAKTAKKVNISFDIAHWELASKYTDDKKALEALKAASDAATDAANAQKSADAAKGSVSDLNDYVDNAFKDEIITSSEAIAISNYINEVNYNKLSLDNQFTKLYSNIYLEGNAKTNLQSAKSALDTATTTLITAIKDAIKDDKTTKEERALVDAKYLLYNQANAAFSTRIEEANNSIQNKLKDYSDAASLAAATAATAATAAQKTANEAKGAVSTLNSYVDGAFKDGIIDISEYQAIEKYINSVNNTKDAVKATYDKLYANAFLKDTAKTDLNAKYTALSTSITNLITSINTAIADKKTTVAEKKDVDAKYALFNTAYAAFNTSIEGANKAIQDELKTYSELALSAAQASQADATKALADAASVNEKVSDLNSYVDGAFKDGIIDLSEATAIEKYINAINESKKVNDAIYVKLYSNPYLDGTPKTDLKAKKDLLDTAIAKLLTSINTAIVDGKTSVEEKADVDAKYGLYSSAIASFNTAIESANNSIQNKLKDYSDAASLAAATAATAANKAQASANEALYSLSDISNDNKLTPEEKQATKKEWDIIVSEKPKNNAIANIFGISTSNYDSVHNALSIYITPLLESLSVTSDIIGSDFRLKFKQYYDARTTLLNAIAQKSKDLADAAASSAYQALLKAGTAQEAAEAAGRVANAAKLRLENWAADNVISPTEKQGIKDEKARIEADQRDIYNGYTKYALGTPTAYDAAYTKYRTQLIALSANTPENITIPSDFTTNQTNYYTQRTLALDAISTAAKKIATDALNNANSALGKIGDFKPVKDALLQETNIEGGLILSSLMALGYKENSVFRTMSGVSGLYNPDKIGGGVAFWAGGAMKDLADYEGETSIPSDVAAGVDRHDGSGYRAFGNMSWNRKGELTVATQYLKIISSTGIAKLEYSSISDQLIFNGNTLFKGANTFRFENTAHITIGNDAFDYLSFLKWLHSNIEEDSTNNAIKFNKSLYSIGGISAKGFTESGGGGGGGGLIESVYAYTDLGKTFSNSVLTDTFNAYTINMLANRIKAIEQSSISEVKWSIITGKPTTIAGYGITDAVLNTDSRLTNARPASGGIADAANKLVTPRSFSVSGAITGSATFDGTANATIATTLSGFDAAKITTGTISIDRLPKGAIERLVVVANDAARFALTVATVQEGDTVKVTGTGRMYFVVDSTKLSTEDGYEDYTVGQASSVPWSGVTSKPTTIAGFGITDGITAATANSTYIKRTGDLLSSSLYFANGQGLYITNNTSTGGNASGVFHKKGASVISGIGAYTTEGNFGYHYIGWGAYPYLIDSCLAVSSTKLDYKGNNIYHAGNFDPAHYLLLTGGTVSGNLTVTGNAIIKNVTADGLIVPYGAGSWLSMATSAKQIRPDQSQTTASAHSLYKVTANNGNVLAFGGSGNQIGFYMFPKANIDNNVNNHSGYYVFNLTDYNLYHGSYMMLDANNYNTWIPSKTGTGASGTWGIDISGTSARTERIGNGNSYMAFKWIGKKETPPWLWGGKDSTEAYVYDPAYLTVGKANQLTTARTIWGRSFDGTINIAGLLSSCSRIKNNSGAALYIGNEDNSSWVYTQNICSDGGSVNWSLRREGVGHMQRLNLGDTEFDNSNYQLRVDGNSLHSGRAVLYSTNVNGAYDTRAIQLREVGLVDSTKTSNAYAPAIGFHWSNTTFGVISLHANGIFHFTSATSQDTNYRSVVAAGFVKAGSGRDYALTGDGGHLEISMSALAGTLVQRTVDGYILAKYINTAIDQNNDTISSVYYENKNDRFIRKKSLINFIYNIEAERPFLYTIRSEASIASGIPATAELTNLVGTGSRRINFTGASGHLIQSHVGTGSTAIVQLYSIWASSLLWRNSTNSDLSTKPWRTILDSSNYTIYSPTLTGGYATGSWNITSAISNSLKILDIRNTNPLPNEFSSYLMTGWFNNTGTPVKDWCSGITVCGWDTLHAVWQLCSGSTSYDSINELYYRNGIGTLWNTWKKILDEVNYINYAPSNDGIGARGTWDISIWGASKSLWNDTANMAFHWSGQGGQPTWLWGGNSAGNMYVYNPSNFNVAYASNAGAVNWVNVKLTPTTVLGYGITNAAIWEDRINAKVIANKNIGYGYTEQGWLYSGPALTFGSGNGYLLQLQANAGTTTIAVRSVTPNVTSSWEYLTLNSDFRLTNARPALDVYAWAKASSKPSYTASEIGLGNVNNTADSSKSVYAATKLTTARTIWGRSFDGTGNITGGLDSVSYISASGNIVGNYVNGNALGVTQNNGSGIGLSLYAGATTGFPQFGIAFATTANGGGHGSISGDWATYFTMSNTDNRGWIFKRVGNGNVASISAAGHAVFNGYLQTMQSLYITSNAYIDYNASNKGLHTNVGFYSDSYISAKGISSTTSSDKRLKCDFEYLNYDEILLAMGKVVTYKYNKRGQELGNDGERHIGSIYQKVEEFMPTIVGVDRYGYGYINYISPDYISLIAGACQLNTLGLYDVMDSVESLEERVERLEQENIKLKQQLRILTK